MRTLFLVFCSVLFSSIIFIFLISVLVFTYIEFFFVLSWLFVVPIPFLLVFRVSDVGVQEKSVPVLYLLFNKAYQILLGVKIYDVVSVTYHFAALFVFYIFDNLLHLFAGAVDNLNGSILLYLLAQNLLDDLLIF
jgi:hypothetical protein